MFMRRDWDAIIEMLKKKHPLSFPEPVPELYYQYLSITPTFKAFSR
jgi:hypothetical protein